MTDNTTTNTNWFRSFARSSSNNTTKQPSPTTTTAPHPNPLTLRTQYHDNHHRHTFHPRVPTPTQHSPTAESPPRGHHSHSHSHSHRKSAGAALRSVSSFWSLKSNTNHTKDGNGGVSPTETGPESEQTRLEQARELGRETWLSSGFEHEPIRAPAPLAMLPLTDLSEVDRCFGDGDDVAGGGGRGREWHNPNLMRMAEMLSAAMARKGAREGLDASYNSCVLSLIEGFYRLTRELRDTEEQLAELKDLRERELEQFRGMTEEWMETGEAYKAEIKRLELMLAKESKDGLASVALARHGSLVDRAGTKRFQDRLKRLSNSQNQDTAKEKPAAAELPVTAEATTGYRTLGGVPRILDSESDFLVSRMLERREMEEWMARQGERQEGRVRAGPVLVRSRGAPELRESLEASRAPEYPNPIMTPNGYTELGSWKTNGDFLAQPNDPRQPGPQRAPSTDNESSSSDSSTSTETGTGFFGFISSGKTKGQPKKTGKQRSESSAAADRPRKGIAKLPRLWTKGGHHSVDESSQGPVLNKKERKRCYSFEKGDDEVLSVTSPPWPPEVVSPLQSPDREEAAAAQGLSVLPWQSGSDSVSTAALGLDGGPITHSTSASTVRWVGDGDGVGKSGGDGNTGHRQRGGSA